MQWQRYTGAVRRVFGATLYLTAAWQMALAQTPQVSTPAARNEAGEYVLQRGDDLVIRAYNLAQLDAEVKIRPDGKISVILLNDVQAAGLTPAQLTQVLVEGFSKHFRSPRITVIVRGIATENVFVGGDVTTPGAFPVRGQLSAFQAVTAAGGVRDPSSDEVIIVRAGHGTTPQQRETISVREIVAGQKPDPVLLPTDTVYVQRSTIMVYVGGEVAKPGLVPLNGALSIISAVFQAGGFLPTAKTDSVVLLRDNGKGGPQAAKIALNDVFIDAPNTKLKPFDVVYVPKTRIAKFDKWIDQYIRQASPIALNGGFGFSYLLNTAFTTVAPF